jgi:putative ABC transport system permease protein
VQTYNTRPPGLFRLLGIQPIAGRIFLATEPQSANAILVSYGFWSRHFGRNPEVIGQQLTVNGAVQTIAGILPRDFHLFDQQTDLWFPIEPPGQGTQDRVFRSWLIAVAKLRSGTSLRSAQTEMNFLSEQVAAANPATNRNCGVKIESIQEAQFGYWKPRRIDNGREDYRD